jgi:uncharacterized protein (DUF1778 family)
MTKKTREHQINFRVSELEKQWLEEIAQARGISTAGFLRMQIRAAHRADKAKETT